MQGEDARCFVPWAGHAPTPHEPWPAQPRESLSGRDRRSSGGGAEPGDTAPTARGWAAPLRGRVPARRTRANQHPKPSAPAPGAGGTASPKAKPHRMRLKRLPGRGEIREDPSRRGCLKPPKALQAPLPRLGKSPGTAAPRKVPAKEPRKPEPERRSRAGRERRPLAEEHGGAQAYRTLRADGGTRPGPHPATAAEPRSR